MYISMNYFIRSMKKVWECHFSRETVWHFLFSPYLCNQIVDNEEKDTPGIAYRQP